ncbi:MAG: DUF998 domain-containing protein [Candidatus Bathyarchaeota archaeon]|nr:MAG: DUF998 domain-containing protein [Candidatus Bathyarchaeum tardum]WNZ28680.1 MAG: DUF998 domain-containing protein [Candidatus Bathyarchaeota archaeon]
MEKRLDGLFGILGPLMVYLSIAVSLAVSPWFNWQTNALSDLGHAVNSEAAAIFNGGLFLAGFFLMLYSLTAFKNHAKYSSLCLLVSSFFVQMLAVINESYGSLHYVAAVPHFLTLSLTSIVYGYEKRSKFAITTFLIVMFTWLLYSLSMFNMGIAVPETMSKLVLLWIMWSGIKILLKKQD